MTLLVQCPYRSCMVRLDRTRGSAETEITWEEPYSCLGRVAIAGQIESSYLECSLKSAFPSTARTHWGIALEGVSNHFSGVQMMLGRISK